MSRSPQQLDDRALWERACRGDDVAWQALRDRFGPGMTALLLARAEPALVPDRLEEVLVRARAELPRVPEPSAVGRWLLDQARTHPLGARPAAGGEVGRMLAHVAKLDDEAAEAVLLEAAAGLDADGIADLLHVRHAEVEARLARGHERLGRAVEPAALARALEPYRYRARPPRKSPLPALLVLVLLGLAAGAFLIVRNLPAQAEGWRVAWTSGAKGADRLEVGGRVETDDEQRARLALGGAGHIDVEPGSAVVRRDAVAGRAHLALERGALGIELPATPLRVTTAAARLEDQVGGTWVVEADEEGRGLVAVRQGAVQVTAEGAPRTYVPAGASCRLLAEGGAGVPWFDDGPEELREVVREGAVAAALMATTPRDTLVLWSLLPRIEEGDRELVVTKLAELVPPPAGIETADVVALEPSALAAWEALLRAEW